MRKPLCVCAMGMLLLSCGGGGGHSPTEAPQVVNVAGSWHGLWTTSGIPVAVLMTLSQNGSSLTGTFSAFTSTFDIKGTASTSGINWSVPNPGCGSLMGSGTGSSLTPQELDGDITLDTRGCSGGGFFTGRVQWFRGSAKELEPFIHGSLEQLTRSLKGEAK